MYLEAASVTLRGPIVQAADNGAPSAEMDRAELERSISIYK